ncbi:hypothetical protein MMC08_003744 [Hypocenomyce scalaris]|nr:hypothetical protein [Hypocenomyce scalaris]
MASILIAAGAGVYYKVKDTKAKHKAERDAHNSSRFAELEKENTERVRRLSETGLAASSVQGRTGPSELASNNPFRDATATITVPPASNSSNPFGSTENLTTDGRRRSSSEAEEEEGEVGRPPGYESVVVDEKKKKKRHWGRNPKLGSLKPLGWGGKKDDGVVR